MMVSPWSDSGGSLPPPRMTLWFLQGAPPADELLDILGEYKQKCCFHNLLSERRSDGLLLIRG